MGMRIGKNCRWQFLEFKILIYEKPPLAGFERKKYFNKKPPLAGFKRKNILIKNRHWRVLGFILIKSTAGGNKAN